MNTPGLDVSVDAGFDVIYSCFYIDHVDFFVQHNTHVFVNVCHRN